MEFNFLRKLDVKRIVDSRGELGVFEVDSDELFQVKRIYWLSNIELGASRGFHAHKQLRQIFIALSGSFRLKVTDGLSFDEVEMFANEYGYLMPEGLWRELSEFSSDAACLVLASEHYDEEDYIHSFSDYLTWKKL